jgi:hypothetical protein
MIGSDVRQVEAEIVACIQKMAVWNVKRDVLLRRLMTIWRDGLELVQLMFAHAVMFHLEEGIQSSLASEHLTATGAYQGLKWAMEYAHDDGDDDVSDEVLVDLVMKVAGPYQALVDAGHDAAIVRYDHLTVAFHKQSPLVDDTDRLTTRWTAGEYRQYWQWLRPIAESAETNTIMGQAGPLAPVQEIMKQPVVVEIPSRLLRWRGFTRI